MQPLLAVFQGNNVTVVVDNKVGGILQGQPKPCASAAMSTVHSSAIMAMKKQKEKLKQRERIAGFC